jgi:chemotaxis protein methyltransferase CheR
MQAQPTLELSPEAFGRISARIQEVAGIRLPVGKETLVRSRLGKRLRVLGLDHFEEYLDYLERDATGVELAEMVDALATNKTSFFREAAHFHHLVATALGGPAGADSLRVWSAGCSTGEEAYTLAMLVRAHLPEPEAARARILATDVSGKALRAARLGEYDRSAVGELPPQWGQRFFDPAPNGRLSVKSSVRALIRFAPLNLMEAWPMRGPFDVIFCRNVMIYFDRETRERLVERFRGLLKDGGVLYVGHSESLSGLNHGFTYVQPAVYRR